VSTRLYWAALADAIDWQQSLLDSHRQGVRPHCTKTNPCGAAEVAARQLARYKAAQAALRRPARRREQ
jgi:hypothetical protein